MLMNIPNGGNLGMDPLTGGGGIGLGIGTGFKMGYGRSNLLSQPAPVDAYVGRKPKSEKLPILAAIGVFFTAIGAAIKFAK